VSVPGKRTYAHLGPPELSCRGEGGILRSDRMRMVTSEKIQKGGHRKIRLVILPACRG